MAFALSKSPAPKPADAPRARKRSPLAGWLGKKAENDDALPELDVAAGLTRALRGSRLSVEKPIKKESEHPVRAALGAIEAALYAIDRIRDTLEQASEIVMSARSVDDAGGRALLAERYDELRLQIDQLIETVDPRAAALIGKRPRHIDVQLGDKTRYSVSGTKLGAGPEGLDLSPPRHAFERDQEIAKILDELDRALGRADRAAAGYCRDAQYLIARTNGAFDG